MDRNREGNLTLHFDKVLTAHYIENDDSFLFHGRNDNAWKLFYLERGALTADMGDGPRVVSGRHAVFCGPGELYTIGAYGGPANLLILSFECSDAALPMLRSKTVPISEEMSASLNNILLELKQNSPSQADIVPLLA